MRKPTECAKSRERFAAHRPSAPFKTSEPSRGDRHFAGGISSKAAWPAVKPSGRALKQQEDAHMLPQYQAPLHDQNTSANKDRLT